MKKIIVVLLVLASLIFILTWRGKNMREIRTEVIIAAPISKVWTIITDFESWKDWSPIINQVSGKAFLGSKLNVTMRNEEGKDGPRYMPVITIFEEPKSFRWRAKMISEFFFTNDKVIELEVDGTGTRLVHKELFSGIMVPLCWGQLNQGVPKMLNSMNEALKLKAEQTSN